MRCDTAETMDPKDLDRYRRLFTRGEARSELDRIMARTQSSLRIADDRGEFYGFERKVFAEAIEALLTRRRDASVLLILHDPSFVERRCPRLLDLLRRRHGALRIMQSDVQAQRFPRGFVLADETVVLRRPHFDSAATYLDFDDQAVAQAAALIDELLEGAVPAFGASVTGL